MNQKIIEKIKLNKKSYFKNILRFDEDKITEIINNIILIDNDIILDIILDQIIIEDQDNQIEIVDECCKYSSLKCLQLVIKKYNFYVEQNCFFLLVTYGNSLNSLECLKFLIENKFKYQNDLIKYCFDLSIVEYLLQLNIQYKQYLNKDKILYLKNKFNENNKNDFILTYEIIKEKL